MTIFFEAKRATPRLTIIAAATIAAMLVSGGAEAQRATGRPNPGAVISPSAADQQARGLVRRMTLDEKIAMVNAAFGARAKVLRATETRIGAGHGFGVPRLGIPELFESDASLGVANGVDMRPGDVATALPSALATGATFDPAIAFSGGAMIGSEARAKGFNVLLAGGINLTRDPWGGRNFEYFGEDPWLSGTLGAEHIRGVESNGIISTAKHFVLNSQETGRTVLDAIMPEAALQESDLLAFRIVIERANPGSVMCSYNRVNGAYGCENAHLLTDILKRDWKFPGWVMSDWGAVHSTSKAAKAGLDQESGQELDEEVFFGPSLKKAVLGGDVPTARLDDMVRRIVRTMIVKGVMKSGETRSPIDYRVNADVAQKVAEAGSVLLRNAGAILPLSPAIQRIAIIGGHADKGVLSGGGSSGVRSVGGSPIDMPAPGGGLMQLVRRIYHASSPLNAIRAQAPNATISFVDGSDPAAAARAAHAADVAIVFAEQWRSEMVDVETLALPDRQDDLIAAVAAANPRTVVVLETGGPVLMPWIDRVAAVLETWYPGQRGGEAIAAILFGKVNPSGRLPITFPASEAQAPRPTIPGLAAVKQAAALAASKPQIDINSPDFKFDMTGGVEPFEVRYVEGADAGYRWYERSGQRPLFPFGYGLSYTQFRYSDLVVTGGRAPTVRFRVTNVGQRSGADVPQVYVAAAPHGGPAIKRLVGFRRVELAPGQSQDVTLPVDMRLVAGYDPTKRDWSLAEGSLPLTVGRYAGDVVLQGTLGVTARRLRP